MARSRRNGLVVQIIMYRERIHPVYTDLLLNMGDVYRRPILSQCSTGKGSEKRKLLLQRNVTF